NDSIDLNSNVVLRDNVLRRNFHHFLPQRNADELIEWTQHEDDAGTFGRQLNAPQPENHRTLVFTQNLDAVQQVENDNSDKNQNRNADHNPGTPHARLRLYRTRYAKT